MRNSLLRKGLVLGIIILFIEAYVLLVFVDSSEINEAKEFLVLKKEINSSLLDNLSWQWAKSAGGINFDCGFDVAVDSSSNTYITGYFENEVTFGSITLISQGGKDVFVAKLNTNGDWQWAKSAGGTGSDSGNGVAVDSSGNTYITGYFLDAITFGSTSLTSQGGNDSFVAKLNTNGDWQWAKSAGGTGLDSGTGIAVDSNGNTYITGYFFDSATFGSITLTSVMGTDIFIAKLNNAGAWQWAKAIGDFDDDKGYDIAVDANGNAYMIGYLYGCIKFDNITFTSKHYEYDVIVAKLDTNGEWQWIVYPETEYSWDIGFGIAVDASSNLYITGYFEDEVTYGSTTLISQGGKDVFVAKLNTNGAWQWAKSAGGIGDDQGNDVAVDSNGNTYITGYFLDAITFGSTSLTSQGGKDVFVAKLNTNGDWQWAKSAGGTGSESGNGVSSDTNNNIYITGDFWSATTFDNITLPNQGDSDIFVAKLSYNVPPVNNPPETPNIDGPTSVKPKISYTWNFTSTDSENDDIFYQIDWGDGTPVSEWYGPYHSGKTMPKSHIYSTKGTYAIQAKAKDIYGHESDWGMLPITVPYSYNPPFIQFWMKLFERFPHAFPILRHLMRY